MNIAWQGLLLCVLGADPDASVQRYLKPAGDKWVLESEVTRSKEGKGSRYVSRTVRGQLSMTLTVVRDESGRLVRAETLLQQGESKKSAQLTVAGEQIVIQRGDMKERVDSPLQSVVTTAPDWTDIFDLVHRYDREKGGLQKMPGVWFHPVNPTLMLTFEVEQLGADTVKVKEKEVPLTRYRVKLRSGNYTVWGFADGRVCKILPPGNSSVPVVLEGYEEAVRELK
jgi:hypothetical protein